MTLILDNEIMAKVIDWLNQTITDLPMPISIKELSLKTPALFAKQTGGTITNRTIAGSYDVDYPVEIYYRTNSVSENDILSASAVLDTLICGTVQEKSTSGDLPELGERRQALGFDVNSYSALVERTDEGTMVYSIIINFRYHQKIAVIA